MAAAGTLSFTLTACEHNQPDRENQSSAHPILSNNANNASHNPPTGWHHTKGPQRAQNATETIKAILVIPRPPLASQGILWLDWSPGGKTGGNCRDRRGTTRIASSAPSGSFAIVFIEATRPSDARDLWTSAQESRGARDSALPIDGPRRPHSCRNRRPVACPHPLVAPSPLAGLRLGSTLSKPIPSR